MSKWLDIHKAFWTISSVKQTTYSQKISELYQVAKCSNTLKLYTLKVLKSIKVGSISFFLIFWNAKFCHFLGCYLIGINSSLIFFLSALRFSNLICQAKILTTCLTRNLYQLDCNLKQYAWQKSFLNSY